MEIKEKYISYLALVFASLIINYVILCSSIAREPVDSSKRSSIRRQSRFLHGAIGSLIQCTPLPQVYNLR